MSVRTATAQADAMDFAVVVDTPIRGPLVLSPSIWQPAEATSAAARQRDVNRLEHSLSGAEAGHDLHILRRRPLARIRDLDGLRERAGRPPDLGGAVIRS